MLNGGAEELVMVGTRRSPESRSGSSAEFAGADWLPGGEPEVTVELGIETCKALATPLTGAGRDRIYAIQTERFLGFAEHQEKTTGVIPVVSLARAD